METLHVILISFLNNKCIHLDVPLTVKKPLSPPTWRAIADYLTKDVISKLLRNEKKCSISCSCWHRCPSYKSISSFFQLVLQWKASVPGEVDFLPRIFFFHTKMSLHHVRSVGCKPLDLNISLQVSGISDQ